IEPVANGTSAALKRDPEMRLQRAVGMWRAFETENVCSVPSYVASITIFPFPIARVVRLVPKPWTVSGVSNEA
ncbi:hypothetical protein GGX14DRAFT_382056, partial [Mycena pura]